MQNNLNNQMKTLFTVDFAFANSNFSRAVMFPLGQIPSVKVWNRLSAKLWIE